LVLKIGDGRFDDLGLKPTGVTCGFTGFVGLDLKTRRGRFSGLGLKTITCRCDLSRPQKQGVADRRIRGGIWKLMLRRSEVENALGPLD
jgi:hypothetical protein